VTVPRAFVFGWTEGGNGAPPTMFRGYCDDRRVMRRMSRRLGVRFSDERGQQHQRVHVMSVDAPAGTLAQFIEAWR